MSTFKNVLKFATIAVAFVFFILLVFWGISASANGGTETALLVIGASGDTSGTGSLTIGDSTPQESSSSSSTTPEPPSNDVSDSSTTTTTSDTAAGDNPSETEAQSVNINDYESNTTAAQYIITDSAGLEKLSSLVEEGVSFEGKEVALAANISVGGSFTPIGNTTSSFKGTFDGAGYAISGLRINSTGDSVGLFSYVDGATIKNVVIDSRGSVTGNSYVGSIVGYFSSGTIDSCTNSGAINSTSQNSSSNAGGIAGYVGSGAKILNCVNTGTVAGRHSGIGGIAGQINGGAIYNCYNTGTVTNSSADTSVAYKTGGIFGYDVYSQFGSSAIVNCYNAANVTCPSSSEKGGAIHGEITSTTSVSNCFYDTQYSDYGGTSSYQYNLYKSFYPSFTNINYIAGITGMDASQMRSADLVERLNNIASGNSMLKSWTNASNVNNGYPYFGTNDRKAYSVVISASAIGAVVADRTLAYPGETVKISVATTTNVSNYELSGISVVRSSDGGVVSSTASFTFVMPESDVNVTPIFTEKQYNISSVLKNTSNGVMTLSKIKAPAGSEVLIAATPTSGNEIEEIKVYQTNDNTKVIAVAPVSVTGTTVTYAFTMPQADVTVSGSFVRVGTATTTTTTTTTITTTTTPTTTTTASKTTEPPSDDDEEVLVPDDEDDDDAEDDDIDSSDTDDDTSDDDIDDTDDTVIDDDSDDTADDDDDADAVIDDDSNKNNNGGTDTADSDRNPVTNVPANIIGLTVAAGSALLIFAAKRRKK